MFTAYQSANAQLGLQVFDGKTGKPIWGTAYSAALQWGSFEPFAVADDNGDGIPDLFGVPNNLMVLDGATGATLAENTTFFGDFTPTWLDVDGDGIPDVTLSGGDYPARTFKKDLATTLFTGPDDRPYQKGAHAACAGNVSVWVQPSTQTQGLIRFIQMAGASAGTMQTAYLAGGVAYASAADAATASGGSGGSHATAPGSKSGCGCQVPGTGGPFEAGAAISLALLAFGARRRRR